MGTLKVNLNETEVLMSSGEDRGSIVIQGRRGLIIKQVEKFKYLGSTLSQEGGCEAEVDSKIKAAWWKGGEVTEVVYDKKMPTKLQVKIYSTVVRPVLMYVTDTWALRRKQGVKLERTEIRMLRWIMGISLHERLKNDEARRAMEAFKEGSKEASDDEYEDDDLCENLLQHRKGRCYVMAWESTDQEQSSAQQTKDLVDRAESSEVSRSPLHNYKWNHQQITITSSQ
ncbi:uncharacterized protein LOC135213391 [Macrobrachium nipponense]|uniref:uncharacterized protein LOC135213391 n=1 Tax=Macrobrachium nipponense TaxID=159736 RepID=UPI0030C89D67